MACKVQFRILGARRTKEQRRQARRYQQILKAEKKIRDLEDQPVIDRYNGLVLSYRVKYDLLNIEWMMRDISRASQSVLQVPDQN